MEERKQLVEYYTSLIELVYENSKDIEQTKCLLTDMVDRVLRLPVVGCSLPSEEELISELDKDLDKMKTHEMKLFRHRNYQRGYDAGFISAYEFIKK